MKKLLKGNNQGFVLVETLIATVFVAAIFAIIYVNFYPLIGEYQKRENYDDVDSKYGTYWVKRFIEDGDKTKFPNHDIQVKSYALLNKNNFCSNILTDANKIDICNQMMTKLDVNKIVITHYSLKNNDESNLKNLVEANDEKVDALDDQIKEYILYLPDYKNYKSLYNFNFRVIVEFDRESKDGMGNTIKYKTFSTMEVNK